MDRAGHPAIQTGYNSNIAGNLAICIAYNVGIAGDLPIYTGYNVNIASYLASRAGYNMPRNSGYELWASSGYVEKIPADDKPSLGWPGWPKFYQNLLLDQTTELVLSSYTR